MSQIITLTTDFGLSDGFVGVMKGVILGINPQATIVDITHDIAPQNIEQGAFVFANACKYFPPNTIHVVVVDPGVGSTRRAIALQAGETFFVAPDNGVVVYAARNLQHEIRAVHLNRPEYWRSHVSNTFHGRDIFAPVAAHLSLGVSLDALGDSVTNWTQLACGLALRYGDQIVGRVVHIDRFGNIVTTIGEEMLEAMDRTRITVTIRGKVLQGVRSTYAVVERGELLALISSSGHVEVAARDESAAQMLGAKLGDEVVIRS